MMIQLWGGLSNVILPNISFYTAVLYLDTAFFQQRSMDLHKMSKNATI